MDSITITPRREKMPLSDDDDDFVQPGEGDKLELPALPTKAARVRRKAGGAGKRVKVFATAQTMLEIADAVNAVQETKVRALTERDAGLAQRLAQREASKKARQDQKKKKLDGVKENLRSSKDKGKNPQPAKYANANDEGEREDSRRKPTGKRVRFAAPETPHSKSAGKKTHKKGPTSQKGKGGKPKKGKASFRK